MVIYATPRESEKARVALQPRTEYDDILTEELGKEGLQHFYRICPWDNMIHAHYIFKKGWRKGIPNAKEAVAIINSDSQSIRAEHEETLAICHSYSGLRISVLKERQRQALETVVQRLEEGLKERVVLN